VWREEGRRVRSQVMAVLQVHQLPPHHALSQEGERDDVLWLQVSVDDPLVVQEPQRIHHISENVNSVDGVEAVVIPIHEFPQVRSSALQHQADHGIGRDGQLVGIGRGRGEGQKAGCGEDGGGMRGMAWGDRGIG
jgi:hypothetical protein